MNNSDLYAKLLKLDRFEQLGQKYYDTYGENLSFSQYLYLQKHSHLRLGIADLFTFSAIAEQRQIAEEIHSKRDESGLTEEYFLAASNNIEIEKTLRYVDIPKHRHQFVECVYIMTGSCEHTINNTTFHQTAGSFTILTANAEHHLNAGSDCLCLGIKIRKDIFLKLDIPNLPLFAVPLCFQCKDDTLIRELILDIYTQQLEKLSYHEAIIDQLCQIILTRCMQAHRDTMQYLYTGARIQSKMLELFSYMYENYQTITLHALAEHFHYSDSYLSNLIHENSGETFSQILSAFKMEQAASLLQTTDLKLNDICDSIGYKDTTQFIRDFKKRYDITPAKYRKQYLVAHPCPGK